jgi:hypothetical protein
MRECGLRGAKPWRTTISDPGAQRPADLVKRKFTAQAPDRLYVCDFTYLRCWEGHVNFAFVIDVFSRRIVGWQLAGHMRTTLVLDALPMALGTRQPGAEVQLVCHSDAGSQYTSEDYQQELSDARVLASIGAVGDAYDSMDELGNYDTASENFPSPSLRKSISMSLPSTSINVPTVCGLYTPDARERYGRVASPPDEEERRLHGCRIPAERQPAVSAARFPAETTCRRAAPLSSRRGHPLANPLCARSRARTHADERLEPPSLSPRGGVAAGRLAPAGRPNRTHI